MKQNHPIFRGIATALITPTTPTGIDYDRFGRLIDWQIQQGINALVICGTTGESSTLTDAEHRRAIAFACERVNGRVPVIAGTGSNETDYAAVSYTHLDVYKRQVLLSRDCCRRYSVGST